MAQFFYSVSYSFDAEHFLVGPFSSEAEAWHLMEADARNEYRIDMEENSSSGPVLDIMREENTICLYNYHMPQLTDERDVTTWTLFSDIKSPEEVRSYLSGKAQKLRLLLFEECNRNCPGCCNHDWDLKSLPVCQDYTPYRLIMLTGGEPMLRPDIIVQAVKDIRVQTDAPIYLYTAYPEGLEDILPMLDGVTITIHEAADVPRFQRFLYRASGLEGKSLRLNVFQEAGELYAAGWKAKNGMKWIKDCPLPKGEVLMRYRQPGNHR